MNAAVQADVYVTSYNLFNQCGYNVWVRCYISKRLGHLFMVSLSTQLNVQKDKITRFTNHTSGTHLTLCMKQYCKDDHIHRKVHEFQNAQK